MELQVLVSKKGTKVVTATNLYQVLQLPNHHYAMNIKKWLNDIYEFGDGIRKPEAMKDYAKRQLKDNPILKDFYLSVQLAKLITLNSRSKVKQKYAKWLYSIEDKQAQSDLLTSDQILAVVELTKAMGLVSCQEACERQHLKTYEDRNNGSASNWWKHRAQIFGYSADKLKQKLKQLGKGTSGKSQRQMLMQVDKYETVRTGVVDLFMALGKNERYAKKIGDLAKVLAKELRLEVFDDRKSITPSLYPPVNPELINEVKELKPGGYLGLWRA